VYNRTFDANVTSVGLLTSALLPLLEASEAPMVINVSSTRGSVGVVMKGDSPPTQSISYSISKTALNMLTYEMAKLEKEERYFVVSPGFAKTGFNGWRGTKDPVDAARVVRELVGAGEKEYTGRFWE
jgi:NAD(P)-dependent dehydrogenase (short-subunit alcohol dehydrogenase family)